MHSSEAAAAAAAAAAAIIDPSYSAYHHHAHPYYRVTGGKEFAHPTAASVGSVAPGSVHHQSTHHHHGHPTSLDPHHPHHSVSALSPSSAAQAAAVQTRILEMRKEKSRDAARSRRGKENHEFYELAKMLPLPAAITSQLDKASIIRLTISYLKLREFSQNGDPSWNNALSSMSALKCKANNVFESHQGTHILQSLDGFAFALGQDGRFLYISETVSIYLGLSQVEMTGSSIFDYTHQQDHAELAEQLGLGTLAQSSSSGTHHSASPLPPASVSSSASNESEHPHHQFTNGTGLITVNGANDTLERQFCIRMKSTLTKRGCQHFKSSGYRVVNIVAHLRAEMLRRGQSSSSQVSNGGHSKIIGLVAIAIALPPPSINELRLEPDMFVTRHSLDFKIIHCEQRVSDLLNYSPDELIGRSIYSLIHGQDVMLLKKYHLDLIHKGQAMSGYYRVINKSGGYTWMQTCATLICNGSTSSNSSGSGSQPKSASSGNAGNSSAASTPSTQDEQEQSVICVNYVLSAIEYTGVIMDNAQLGHKGLGASTPSTRSSSPAKIRSVQIKKSHSSTPSPEVNSSGKMSTNCDQHSPHSVSMSRSQRLAPSPLESPPSSGSHHRVESAKRRRLNSSPVRPWKSPSPPTPGGLGQSTVSSADSPNSNSSPNLLRHISVIRETPPILKPQVMTPPTYHPHHHYHHLVDQYAAAYHLYKSNPSQPPSAIAPQTGTTPPHHHHWGAYG